MKEDLTAVFERFMPRIKTLAKRVRRKYPAVELEDLQQAGTEGLLKAMDRYDEYDPSKGAVDTWLHPYVNGAMLMHVRREATSRRYEQEVDDALHSCDDSAVSFKARTVSYHDVAETYLFNVYAERTPEDEALTQETLKMIEAYHSELSELEREVFRLRYAEHLTLEETGLAVGYSRGGVCRVEQRMHAKLRQSMDRGG